MNAARISCLCRHASESHGSIFVWKWIFFYHLLRCRFLSLPSFGPCIHHTSMTESHTNFQCHHIETIILALVSWFSLMSCLCVNVAHAKIHSNIDEHSRTAYYYTRCVWDFVCRSAFNASVFAFGYKFRDRHAITCSNGCCFVFISLTSHESLRFASSLSFNCCSLPPSVAISICTWECLPWCLWAFKYSVRRSCSRSHSLPFNLLTRNQRRQNIYSTYKSRYHPHKIYRKQVASTAVILPQIWKKKNPHCQMNEPRVYYCRADVAAHIIFD